MKICQCLYASLDVKGGHVLLFLYILHIIDSFKYQKDLRETIRSQNMHFKNINDGSIVIVAFIIWVILTLCLWIWSWQRLSLSYFQLLFLSFISRKKKLVSAFFFSLQEVPWTAPFHDSSQAEVSGFRNNSSVAFLALDPVSVARTLIRCPDDFYFGFYLLEVSVISITAGARRELAAL